MIFLPRYNRFRKPTGQLEVDPRSSLSDRLVFCAPATEGSGCVVDIVNKSRVTSTTRPVWKAKRGGLTAGAWEMPDTYTSNLVFSDGKPFTCAVFFRLDAGPANSEFPSIFQKWTYVNESSNKGWAFTMRPPNDGGGAANKWMWGVFRDNGSISYACLSSTNWAAGDHLLVGTSDGTVSNTRKLYLDGLLETTKVANGQPFTSTATVYCAGDSGASKQGSYISYCWNRLLSPLEAALLWENPWRVVRSSLDRFIIIMPPQMIDTGHVKKEKDKHQKAERKWYDEFDDIASRASLGPLAAARSSIFGQASATFLAACSVAGLSIIQAAATRRAVAAQQISLRAELDAAATRSTFAAGQVGAAAPGPTTGTSMGLLAASLISGSSFQQAAAVRRVIAAGRLDAAGAVQASGARQVAIAAQLDQSAGIALLFGSQFRAHGVMATAKHAIAGVTVRTKPRGAVKSVVKARALVVKNG